MIDARLIPIRDPARQPLARFLKRLTLGLPTVLGLRRRGFFIPYRYAAEVPKPADRSAYSGLEALFRSREDAFQGMIAAIERWAPDLERIGSDPPPAPRWRQGWFPRLDAAAAYAMVRTRRPKRIVEVGSGHSTRFFARAAADEGIATTIVAIDPAPRADIARLGAETMPTVVPRADAGVFAQLGSGDVLSIDSSHILLPGTDVDHLLNVALPRLPGDVLLHVHDIFLPDDYPAAWGWRGYNEQLGIAGLLQGGGFEILWASRYVVTRMPGALAGTVVERLEILAGAPESSLWLRKTAGPAW